jgi:hypothetical protein
MCTQSMGFSPLLQPLHRFSYPHRLVGIRTYPRSGDFSRSFLLRLNTLTGRGDVYAINGLQSIVTAPPQVFMPSQVSRDSYLPL